jgi:transcriptional regulator with XRE-family HTH domain
MAGGTGNMNNDTNKQTSLSDVLDALQLSGETLTPEILEGWMSRYPQFEREIMNFAAFDAIISHSPDNPENTVISREASRRSLAKVKEIVAHAFAENSNVNAAAEEIISLTEAGERQNLRFPQIAMRAGLSIPLLANLEQRFVRFASVPEEVINKLADVLKISARSIAAYLQMPPAMTMDANFKSQDQPQLPEAQADFFALVDADPMLTREQKRNLLKLKK